MPQITSILLNIQTGTQSDAGTDGDVYLGLCGREFYIDSDQEDFESGNARTYAIGNTTDGTPVLFPQYNDPRLQMLLTENVGKFPMYIRFVPRNRNDNWQLQRANVRLNDGLATEYDTYPFVENDAKKGIWLGIHCGQVVYLLQSDPTEPRKPR